jgi:hypothetical protein
MASADMLERIWAGDHLCRRAEADHLTKYLTRRHAARRDDKGFVLAINAEWGAGKTFLMTRWRDQLAFQDYPVVYFDAWANDYTSEPLVAFIAELDKALAERFHAIPAVARLRVNWSDKAKAVLAPTVKAMGLALAKQLLGQSAQDVLDEYDDAWQGGAVDETNGTQGAQRTLDVKALGKDLEKAVAAALKEHTNTKLAIAAFKERMAALIEHLESRRICQLPLFVLIDELDRCRPDYAIKLMEGIKHLFGVPGVHFVVATNLKQFASSVRAVYGAGFDSERYLKRFFDQEYQLPRAEGSRFAASLLAGLPLPDAGNLVTGLDTVLPDFRPHEYLPFIFERYASAFGLEPRDQEQIARTLEAALLGLSGVKVHIHFLLLLAMALFKAPEAFRDMVRTHGADGAIDTFLSATDGRFQVPAGTGAPHTATKTVHVGEIAQLYFAALAGQTADRVVAATDFPGNLLPAILDAYDDGSLASYPELVQWAGRFVAGAESQERARSSQHTPAPR